MPGSQFHTNILLRLHTKLLTNIKKDIHQIGQYLQTTGMDDPINRGFWLYNYQTGECYYSDNFIRSLGYDRSEVKNDVQFFYDTSNNE